MPTDRDLRPSKQYGASDDCAECRRPLSRYNPYAVCGPCRVRLADKMIFDYPRRAAVALTIGEVRGE